MLEKAKAIVDLFRRRGYVTFFIGGKPRNDAKNSGKPDKIIVHNIDIITSAPIDAVKKMFPTCTDTGLVIPSVTITFAGQQFKILFFEYDKSVLDNKFISIKSMKVKTKYTPIPCLDIVRSKLDFTVNALVQELNSTVIDYTFYKNNQLISALQDVRKEIIRAINNEQTFIDDPRRILRMFKLQSMLGFKIDTDTFNQAKKHKELLSNITEEEFITDFNAIITSAHVKTAIQHMQQFGFFNIKFQNKPFMSVLNNIPVKDLSRLEKYCKTVIADPEDTADLLEAYTLLLISCTPEQIRESFSNFHAFDSDDIERIIWLSKHQDMLDRINLRQKIFNAKDGIVARDQQNGMLIVIKKMAHIAKQLYGKQAYIDIYSAYCERPYFANQLRVTSEDILSYIDKESLAMIESNRLNDIKNRILWHLVNVTNDWPYAYDKYMLHVKQGILDVLPNAQVNIPPEVKLVDDYGNTMDHMKAIQHRRVPIELEVPPPKLIFSTDDVITPVHANEDLSDTISENNVMTNNVSSVEDMLTNEYLENLTDDESSEVDILDDELDELDKFIDDTLDEVMD